MPNKLVNQQTFFPMWHAFNESGVYVGRIEKDQYGVWRLYDKTGRNLGIMDGFKEARIEARDFLK